MEKNILLTWFRDDLGLFDYAWFETEYDLKYYIKQNKIERVNISDCIKIIDCEDIKL